MFPLRRMIVFLFLILYMQYFIFLCRNFKNYFFTYRALLVHNDTTYCGSVYCAGRPLNHFQCEIHIFNFQNFFLCDFLLFSLFLLDVQLIRCWISWIGSLILSVSFLFLSTFLFYFLEGLT